MFRERGTKSIFEDEIKCTRFRRILEPDDTDNPARGANPRNRSERLIQIWDENGRLRTLAVKDIVDVS